MTLLVTGVAGFIGYHLTKRLLEVGHRVIGIDNLNDYYEVRLKEDRLAILKQLPNFTFKHVSLEDGVRINQIFQTYKPKKVINMAAQAGVRYSLTNPGAYVDSNLVGFVNILEACRHNPVEHLVYASSSSVYGSNPKTPFSVHDNVDHPISLYAATKKANELMAHTYSHLYKLPTTGLRFFTVYGPWGRPDMAPFIFAKAILEGRSIPVFNHGRMKRDFTYIDDIVEGIVRVMDHIPKADPSLRGEVLDPGISHAPYRIYNIGNNRPVELMYFISALEAAFGKEAEKEYLPMQPGDVPETYADIDDLQRDVGFKPDTDIEEGIRRFAAWYREYYKI